MASCSRWSSSVCPNSSTTFCRAGARLPVLRGSTSSRRGLGSSSHFGHVSAMPKASCPRSEKRARALSSWSSRVEVWHTFPSPRPSQRMWSSTTRSTRTSLTTRNTTTLRFWTLDRRLPCFRQDFGRTSRNDTSAPSWKRAGTRKPSSVRSPLLRRTGSEQPQAQRSPRPGARLRSRGRRGGLPPDGPWTSRRELVWLGKEYVEVIVDTTAPPGAVTSSREGVLLDRAACEEPSRGLSLEGLFSPAPHRPSRPGWRPAECQESGVGPAVRLVTRRPSEDEIRSGRGWGPRRAGARRVATQK